MNFVNFGPNQNEIVNGEKKPSEDIQEKKKKEFEDFAIIVLEGVIDDLTFTPNKSSPEDLKILDEQIYETMNSIAAKNNKHFLPGDKQKIAKLVIDEIISFGPITSLLEDPTVTEVMVNGPDKIFVERFGKIEKSDKVFRNNQHVMHTIDKIVAPIGRRVDESSPMVDARLPDGSRVNVIIPPLAIKGPTITIRKFSAEPYGLEDLITFGSLNMSMAKFLRACVRGRLNIIVSGGTGSGKTTLMNVISSFISHDERIVTIEDAAEMQLQQEHVVTLESRTANIEGKGKISIRDLVVNSLRMRPDRIIVGEVRSGEALDMLQAMNTGHDGSITTVHANSPRDALSRLETMVLMSGMDLPTRAIREQVSSAIDLVIQISRFNDGTRKVTKITEVIGMENDTITMQDIFHFNQEGFDETNKVLGHYLPNGIVPTFLEKLRAHGENVQAAIFKCAE